MTGILAGLRIVEGSAFIAAPLGGMTLAQLGADVIRFDDIKGGLDNDRWPITRDGRSIYWAGLNKGKRSIAVDLRSPRGRELLTALITAPGEGAGIFTTNMPARGWLAYEELAKKRADLIALNIVGARDGSAHVDYTVNAITGFPMVTGPVGHDGPVNAVAPPWDLATAYVGAMAILAAERHRRLTGQGQRIVLPLQDMALAATSALGYIGEAVVNQVDRPRFGNEIFGTFGRDFRTKEGRFVMICIFSDRHVDALASAGGFAAAFKKIEAAKGILSAQYLKDVTDPQWKNEPGFKGWAEFMGKYYPGGSMEDAFNAYGYTVAQTLVHVLKQCGNDLSRANIMKQAASINGLALPMLLPGIRVNTGPNDFFPVEQMQLGRFDGEHWVLFGELFDASRK